MHNFARTGIWFFCWESIRSCCSCSLWILWRWGYVCLHFWLHCHHDSRCLIIIFCTFIIISIYTRAVLDEKEANIILIKLHFLILNLSHFPLFFVTFPTIPRARSPFVTGGGFNLRCRFVTWLSFPEPGGFLSPWHLISLEVDWTFLFLFKDTFILGHFWEIFILGHFYFGKFYFRTFLVLDIFILEHFNLGNFLLSNIFKLLKFEALKSFIFRPIYAFYISVVLLFDIWDALYLGRQLNTFT